MKTFNLLLLPALVASVWAEDAEPRYKKSLVEALKASNIVLANLKDEKGGKDSPLPKCFEEYFSFSLKSIFPKGGGLFITKKKDYGDAIAGYYRSAMVVAVAGPHPYVYQSKDGRIVVQLNNGLTTKEAEAFETALKEIEVSKLTSEAKP